MRNQENVRDVFSGRMIILMMTGTVWKDGGVVTLVTVPLKRNAEKTGAMRKMETMGDREVEVLK